MGGICRYFTVLCPRGLERAVRQRRDAPGELICGFMKCIGLADQVIVPQPSWNNKVGLGQGHDDLANMSAGFEVLMSYRIFV